MTREVRDKKELKKAIKDQIEVIAVSNGLKKDLQPLIRLMKLPKKKIAEFIAFLSVTGTALIGGVTSSPLTGGMTGGVAFLATSSATTVFAVKSGIEIAIIAGVLILCVSLGVTFILEVLNNYEVETEVEIGTERIVFTRKTNK